MNLKNIFNYSLLDCLLMANDLICFQALPKHIVEHPPLAPIESQGTPNSLGLRFELDARHFASSPHLTVRCIALVGSRLFETARRVQLTHANNQRYSAGEIRNAATANSAICGAVLPLLVLVGTLVTWPGSANAGPLFLLP